MKRKLLLCALLGTALTLSGCASLLDKIPGGELIKKLDVLNLISDEPGTTNQTGGNNSNNSSNAGGQTQTGSLLDTLKAKAKPVAAKMLGKSESAITFGEYEDENSSADVYYYNASTLTFVDIETSTDSYDTGMADRIKSYLPSTATLSENSDYLDLMDDYGVAYYDRYYIDGDYTYNVYVEAYDEMSLEDETYPAESYGCVYIYKTSQQSAFDSYFSEEE